MDRKRTLASISIILGASLVFGACTSAPQESTSKSTGKSTGSSEIDLTLPDESKLTPQDGGTLSIGLSGGGLSATSNPNNAIGNADFLRAAALYEKLTNYDENGVVAPHLAESLQSNSDATMWTIKLRPNVKFQDGSTLDAEDVLYSWKMIREGGWKAAKLLEIIDLDKTKAVDDLTLEVALTRPVATLPEFLAADGMYIQKKGFTDYKSSNGTGPFDLAEWRPTDRAILKRKASYWRGPAHLDQLVVIEITDYKAGARALRSGQIDILPKVATEDLKSLSQADGFYVANQPGSLEAHFYMRVDRAPFNDPNVRTAMKLAIDRKACLDVAAGGVGRLANDLPGPAGQYYAKQIPQRDYDPEAAKQALAKSGIKDLTVTLTAGPAYPSMMPCAQAFQQSAKKAGINIEIKNIPPEDNWNRDAGYMQRDFGMSSYNGVPIEIMVPGFLLTGARNNATHQADRAFDEAYWEAIGTIDPKKRAELFEALQKSIWENSGAIIWGETGRTFGFSDRVHGAKTMLSPNPTLSSINIGLEKLWVSQ
jgi:peptide/nickel transport system substrate-binding protein